MQKIDLSEFKKLDIKNLIATNLSKPRDSCRLMVLDRNKNTITHKYFYHLSEYLQQGDCIILNRSKVWKAKLTGQKSTGGKIEILLIAPSNENLTLWHALSKKPFKNVVTDVSAENKNTIFIKNGIEARCIKKNEDGSFVLEFSKPITQDYLDKFGEIPLPQYIINARKRKNETIFQDNDIEHYQTVYAEESGSIAAPTAGLHFTENLLNKLKNNGVQIVFITLHIGWGTFKPVRTKNPETHKMLEENCSIDEKTAKTINDCKKNEKRIVAVGTSVMRALETFANADDYLEHGTKNSGIFIYPGYKFKVANAFITNFHVPDSAPLYMTAAFAGKELLFKAYKEAVQEKYKFYSYGDAMLII